MPNTGIRPQWSCHGHSHAGFSTGLPTRSTGGHGQPTRSRSRLTICLPSARRHCHVGGPTYSRSVYGELVRKRGKWMTDAPRRCPNGHPLGPNQVLVGHVACLGHGGGGHTSWHCRTCDAVVYGPPLNTHCTTLDGPASRVSVFGLRRYLTVCSHESLDVSA